MTKTRGQIYGQEASSLLRDITMYQVLTEEQILRLYPGKCEKIRNLLSYLQKQGRIFYENGLYYTDPESIGQKDRGLLAAVWVLLDLIDQVEFHSTGDYPAKIIFFAGGEVYEIIHAELGKEALISHLRGSPDEESSRRLILVDDPEQIAELDIPNVNGYCTVSPDGEVQYYQKE